MIASEGSVTDSSIYVKLLFVTYCFGPDQGQALVGVYKRGLRIALELCERGHDVAFFCTGRHNFHDELTRRAEQELQFVDLSPFDAPVLGGAESEREFYLKSIAELSPDVIVVGEAPLAGTLLESTLCGVELGIPVVVLDNAYRPMAEAMFCSVYGPMMDGIILTGPSSFHQAHPPAYLCQVPPYIEASPQEAQVFLTRELGLSGDRLITIMAYDSNVERLGITLLAQLGDCAFEALFLTRDVEGCRKRLSSLPLRIRERTQVSGLQPERILFGLLQLSRLAVGKCAFMQVTECLSLRTPIIGFYFQGDFSLNFIPFRCRSFAHSTSHREADAATVAAARRFLNLTKDKIRAIHNGEFGAAARAADFLESLALRPRQNTWDGSGPFEFSEPIIRVALGSFRADDGLIVRQLRAMCLRILPGHRMFSLVCRYTVDTDEQFVRMWGHIFSSRRAAEAEWNKARAPGSGRYVLYYSRQNRMLIERDLGEEALPDLKTPETILEWLQSCTLKLIFQTWLRLRFHGSTTQVESDSLD
jgi:hypothetical protein